MRTLVGVAVLMGTLSVVAQGCSSSVCSYQKACPNDPTPTADQIKLAEDQCHTLEDQYRSSPCFGQFENYASCLKNNYVCNSSGMTDQNLTTSKQNLNCNNAKTDIVACCVKNPGAKGC